jgi:hypothetical protein
MRDCAQETDMACTRDDAIFRLIAAWCARAIEDAPQGSLADLVTSELVRAVQCGDLLREFSEDAKLNKLTALREEGRQRAQSLIRAWSAPAPAGRQ